MKYKKVLVEIKGVSKGVYSDYFLGPQTDCRRLHNWVKKIGRVLLSTTVRYTTYLMYYYDTIHSHFRVIVEPRCDLPART